MEGSPWNIRDAGKLEATLDSLRVRVVYWDVVIVTRGGGDRIDLDVFESRMWSKPSPG
jgi:hypothetical protein